MMVTPHHEPRQQQVRVAGAGNAMTSAGNSDKSAQRDERTQGPPSIDTNDCENSSASNATGSWRQSQRASLKRLEASQKLNLILPTQGNQAQQEFARANNQPEAHYLLAAQQQQLPTPPLPQDLNGNKLTNCLSTPVIITSDGLHQGHLSSAGQHPQAMYSGQQQQQQQLLIDSLAQQLNQGQSGEVSLFTGLPSCTPASADRLASSAINPFFRSASGAGAPGDPLTGGPLLGALAEENRHQGQWPASLAGTQTAAKVQHANASQPVQQYQQQQQQHQNQQQQHLEQQRANLTIADLQAATLSPIIFSPLSFLGFSPEQEAWLRYGYVSPQQHPLANRTYVTSVPQVDYSNQQQQHPQQHPQHHNYQQQQAQQSQQQQLQQHQQHQQQQRQQPNFASADHVQQSQRAANALAAAEQIALQGSQVAKDLTRAMANQPQQQQAGGAATGHLHLHHNAQQLGASAGKSANFSQQKQQELEPNHFHAVTGDALQQRQQQQIFPAHAKIAVAQQYAQQAAVSETRATRAQISCDPSRPVLVTHKSAPNETYPQQPQQQQRQQQQQQQTPMQHQPIAQKSVGGVGELAALTSERPRSVVDGFACQLRVSNSDGNSARASPAQFAGHSSSSNHRSGSNSTFAGSQSSRTTSCMSSSDVSPAASDLELSNAGAADKRPRPALSRADSLSSSTSHGEQRLAVAATAASGGNLLVSERAATATEIAAASAAAAAPTGTGDGSGTKGVATKGGVSKRRANGADKLTLVPGAEGECECEPPVKKSRGGRKKKQVTHEELMARKNRSKERNRVAARRCRQKRKQFLDELRERIEKLNTVNEKLERENLSLLEELSQLKRAHGACQAGQQLSVQAAVPALPPPPPQDV